MDEPSNSAEPARPSRRVGWWIGLISTQMVMGGLFALRAWRSDGLAPLTPNEFYAARERWRAVEPPDYDIEIVVRGSQPATYAVQVRNGQAETALRNGKPLNQRRTFGTWSVPGMFSTVERDVEAVQRRDQSEADPNLPRLTLRAEFDPEFSYPACYRRIEWGSPVEVSWEVTRFEVKRPK